MNLNKVLLIGRITKNPEVNNTAQGSVVAKINIATNRTWKDQKTGQSTTETEYHNIVAWRKIAEVIGNYCKKGDLIYIEGRLATRSWEDKSGVKRYITEIIAESVQLGPKEQEKKEEKIPVIDDTKSEVGKEVLKGKKTDYSTEEDDIDLSMIPL